MGVPLRGAALRAIAAAAISGVFAMHAAALAPPDAFDELYSRGQKTNAALKTLTGRFTETTTSTLLTKPIVARGTLAVERPSRVVLRYTDPDLRTVLIDGNKMTTSWPSRNLRQVTDIGTAQGRVQKYFVNGNASDLRGQFEIEDHTAATDRPGTYYITMAPKRKQIREALARLDLWVGRTSMLLEAMKMTFANGDTKMMVFEDVVVNGPLEPGVFTTEPR